MKTKKKRTKKQLKLIAWKLFSEWIRRRYATEEGYAACVTCGKTKLWQNMQSGHFISGRNLSILFEEEATHVQCVGCNCFGGGKQKEYYLFMRRRYGLKRIDELYIQANTIRKYSIGDYEELIESLKVKLKGLDDRTNP